MSEEEAARQSGSGGRGKSKKNVRSIDAGEQSGPQGRRRNAGPGLPKLRAEVKDLRRRVTQLETDLQECRQLNKRLAEVTDAVAEVLLPADQRDESRLRELLQGYDQKS